MKGEGVVRRVHGAAIAKATKENQKHPLIWGERKKTERVRRIFTLRNLEYDSWKHGRRTAANQCGTNEKLGSPKELQFKAKERTKQAGSKVEQ